MGKYADIIKAVKQQGYEVAVVLGGGALAREFIGIAKNLGLDMNAQDEVAFPVHDCLHSCSSKNSGPSLAPK